LYYIREYIYINHYTYYIIILKKRLWSKVSEAIKSNKLDIATDEKTVIENKQRMDVKKRKAEQKEHFTKYFTLNEKNEYKFMGIKR
jgi:hypothetical protein